MKIIDRKSLIVIVKSINCFQSTTMSQPTFKLSQIKVSKNFLQATMDIEKAGAQT
jgi:hypothetical protein